MAHLKIDETGNQHGRLVVVASAGLDKDQRAIWECLCICGNRKVVTGKWLRHGKLVSCGCWNKEELSKRAKAYTGENNPNFNSKITDEERTVGRFYYGYREWRVQVYERDNFTCQICGDNKGGNLNAHHLQPYNNNSELRTALSNGVTLCEDCHLDFHHQYGYKNSTAKQFKKFKEVMRKKCQKDLN